MDAGQRASVSAHKSPRFASGLASAALHVAAIGALAIVVTRPLPLPLPDEHLIDLVFEQPAAVPGAQPEPAPSATEAPSEPAAPVPTTPAAPVPTPEQPPVPPMPEPPPQPPPRKAAPSPPDPVRPLRPPPKPQVPRPPPSAPAEKTPVFAPPATRPLSTAPVTAATDQGWAASVAAWLAAHRTYPVRARERGDEGIVSVRFTIDRSGRVVEAAIMKPSGSSLLDEAALDTARRATFSAFPATMPQAQVTMTVSIRYSLR